MFIEFRNIKSYKTLNHIIPRFEPVNSWLDTLLSRLGQNFASVYKDEKCYTDEKVIKMKKC